MYGYPYEDEVLQCLRIMKCLHRQDPSALEKALKLEDSLDEDAIFAISEYLIWEIFQDVVMDEDEDSGFETAEFTHPAFQRFCALNSTWNSLCGSSTGAWRRKLSDITEYFLESKRSVCDAECLSLGESARIKVWFSPDCYDSLEFGNALVDLLLWLQKENERLGAMLKEAEYGKEAA